jgi:hypothetical protein
MNLKFAVIGLLAALLAACAPASAPPPAAAPAPPPPAAEPAPAPEPAAATAPVVIRTLSCAELLGATDDDRAAASMFIIGYRAALAHSRALAIGQIEGIEEAALAICAKNPKMTAINAFGKALATTAK